MSRLEREAFSARGGFCPDSIQFLEDVCYACHIVKDDSNNKTLQTTRKVTKEFISTRDLGMSFIQKESNNNGVVLLSSVTPNGQADLLGEIKKDMQIYSINDVKITNQQQIETVINDLKKQCQLIMIMAKELPSGDNENQSDEITFDIDVSIPLGMGIDHPSEDKSHFPAVITQAPKGYQAQTKGVLKGMHIHSVNGLNCRDKKLPWVLGLVKQAKEKVKINVVFVEKITKKEKQKNDKNEKNDKNDTKDQNIDFDVTGATISATFDDGPLGIKFTSEGEVRSIIKSGQAGGIVGLSQGDLLIQIGEINVENMTLKQLIPLIKAAERPMKLIFQQHKEYARGPNGLPKVDTELLENLWDQYDTTEKGLNASELANFISHVHSLAWSHSKESIDIPNVDIAQQLIDSHDTSMNSIMEKNEFLIWVERILNMSVAERTDYTNRGGWHIHAVRIVEDIANALRHEEDGEKKSSTQSRNKNKNKKSLLSFEDKEAMDKRNLKAQRTKILFDSLDIDGNGLLTVEEMIPGLLRVSPVITVEEAKQLLTTACSGKNQKGGLTSNEFLILVNTPEFQIFNGEAKDNASSQTMTISRIKSRAIHTPKTIITPNFIRIIFGQGEIGCRFNYSGEYVGYVKGTQCELVNGIDKGDQLIRIGRYKLEGEPLSKVEHLLLTKDRPLTIELKRHRQWKENESNGLPELDENKFKELWTNATGVLDSKNTPESLTAEKLCIFMNDMHTKAATRLGKALECYDYEKFVKDLLIARKISANGKGKMSYSQFLDWLNEGLNMSGEHRNEFKLRGDFNLITASFLEDISACCYIHGFEQKWNGNGLPTVTRQQLIALFSMHSSSKTAAGYLDSDGLMLMYTNSCKIIQDTTFSLGPSPSIKTIQLLIDIYDNSNTRNWSLHEFTSVIEDVTGMNIDKKQQLYQQGSIFGYAVCVVQSILLSIVLQAAYEHAPKFNSTKILPTTLSEVVSDLGFPNADPLKCKEACLNVRNSNFGMSVIEFVQFIDALSITPKNMQRENDNYVFGGKGKKSDANSNSKNQKKNQNSTNNTSTNSTPVFASGDTFTSSPSISVGKLRIELTKIYNTFTSKKRVGMDNIDVQTLLGSLPTLGTIAIQNKMLNFNLPYVKEVNRIISMLNLSGNANGFVSLNDFLNFICDHMRMSQKRKQRFSNISSFHERADQLVDALVCVCVEGFVWHGSDQHGGKGGRSVATAAQRSHNTFSGDLRNSYGKTPGFQQSKNWDGSKSPTGSPKNTTKNRSFGHKKSLSTSSISSTSTPSSSINYLKNKGNVSGRASWKSNWELEKNNEIDAICREVEGAWGGWDDTESYTPMRSKKVKSPSPTYSRNYANKDKNAFMGKVQNSIHSNSPTMFRQSPNQRRKLSGGSGGSGGGSGNRSGSGRRSGGVTKEELRKQRQEKSSSLPKINKGGMYEL